MSWVFPPPVTPSVAVHHTEQRFGVRRIFCIGRNYAAHAREMGADPGAQPPTWFTKPADAVIDAGATAAASMAYPPLTNNLHHEVELAVALQSGGRDIASADALGHVFGYAVSLDLTRRDLQSAAKAKGQPWDAAKAFDASAPIAPIVRATETGHPIAGRIWLTVNNEPRQEADLSELIWPIADIIAHLSRSVALRAGDLILTGTPAGVGPLVRGDVVRAGVLDLPELLLTVR